MTKAPAATSARTATPPRSRPATRPAASTATDAHLDPTRKHTAILLIEAIDSNPNGDPDGGNQPRTDPETGQGLLSDVSIKRKIRDTVPAVVDANSTFDSDRYGIFVTAGVALNATLRAGAEAVGRTGKKTGKVSDEDKESALSLVSAQQQWLREHYYDIRMFGGVLSTGDFPAGKLTGPLQVEWARSVDPVVPTEHTITRVNRTAESDDANNQIGAKWMVPFGLYVTRVHYSPFDGARAGVTSDDLAVLWSSLAHMYEHTRSASRPNVATAGLYVFSHANPLGDAPSRALGRAVACSARVQPPRNFDDYDVIVSSDNLPASLDLIQLV